jgi:hypothetical protein
LKKGTISSIWAGTVAVRPRKAAAPRAIAEVQKYFQRLASPFGSRYTTLRQSSTQPTAPKPRVTKSTTHTYLLLRSAHSSVVTTMEIRISAPPIVGVPALVRCDLGPSSRTAWPIFLAASQRITGGPNNSDNSSAVPAASMVRSVR